MATVHIELGTGFWILIIFIVIMGILMATLGTGRLRNIITGGFQDAFHR